MGRTDVIQYKPTSPRTSPRRVGLMSSLAFKIVFPMVGIIAMTCVLLFTIYSMRSESLGNDILKEQLETFASSKATELSEPLWNFQTDLLERLMRSYLDNHNLLRITLYDTNDQVIAEKKAITDLPYTTVMTTERKMTRTSGGQTFDIGRLEVQYHDGHLQKEMSGHLISDSVFTLILMAVLAGTLWLSVHVLVARPLHRLRQSLHDNMSNSRRTPLVWKRNDDLGAVVEAYNELLEEVELRTESLVKMNYIMRSEIDQRRIAERELAKIRDELEHKVTLRTIELKRANEELRELDKQRAAFLASASHELRTPLAAVLGFATLVRKQFVKHFIPRIDEIDLAHKGKVILNNLEIIGKEGDRLTRLIDDLLDLNKIESGHIDWRDQDLDVCDELQSAAETMSAEVDRNPDLSMIVEADKNLPPIYCDPDRFQQVLINLLSNAVKHTQAGVIRLQASAEAGMVTIRIYDTGKGIGEEDLPFIFHRFYQSGGEQNFKPSGTGLGLPIAKNIVEHYRGHIRVESEPGVGSTFIVEIPAAVY